ncbi:unnamed protein product [Auanema sp. JU1783]|nr:unnamed protein product [Auanema sp. JU1783]
MNTKRNLEANKSSADGEKGNQNLEEKASTNSADIVAELIRDVENSDTPFDVADLAYARSSDRSRKEKKEKKDKKKKKKKKKRKHESRDRSRERSRERSKEKDKERKRKSKKSEKNRDKEDIREKHKLKSPQKLKRTKLEESVSAEDEDDDFTVTLKAVKETKLVINIKSSLTQEAQKSSELSAKDDRITADDSNATLDDDDNTGTRASKIIEKTVARITKKEESRLRNKRDDSSDDERSRYRSKRDRSYNRDKGALKSRRSRSRSRSRDRRRQRSRSYERRTSRKRYSRSRSRSRSNVRTNDRIDKAKLLEIAQSKAQRIKAMDMLDPRSGNPKSIDDFVSYCEKLQRSQEKEDKGGSGGNVENDFELETFPARLKQAEPIKIKISNGNNFAMQSSETNSLKLLSSQPASHLEWTKVEPKTSSAPHDQKRYNVSEKKSSSYSILPPPPMPPSFLPPPPTPPNLCPPPPPMPVLSESSGNERSRDKSSTNQFAQVVPQGLVTPRAAFNMNSKKYAVSNFFYHGGDQMTSWANVTGKYTGSTGLNEVCAAKLPPSDGSVYTLAEKDVAGTVSPTVSVLGLKLMYKMGWRPGKGLGPKCEGLLEPVMPDVKHDRKGLQTEEERKSLLFQKMTNLCETSKHPVSQLMELCTKNKWPLPQFYFSAQGPPHNREFSCSALVNNVQYETGVISRTKKDSHLSLGLSKQREFKLVE